MHLSIRNLYSPRGLLIRLAFDVLVANLGMLLGTIISVALAITRFPTISQEYFREMFVEKWIYCIPILSFSCVICFPLSGLYGIDLRGRYRKIILPVAEALGGSIALHGMLIYMIGWMIPRSLMVSGWLCIAFLMFAGRLGRSFFVKCYRLIPVDSREVELERIENNLAVAIQTDGWLPPESPQAKAPWPHFDQDEVVAAAAVLRSGRVNQWTGREVGLFQDEFKEFCGSKYAIALTNGTVALELALHALGIGPGDEVVVTPRTFVASGGCVKLAGARPVFADIDRDSQNITAATIARVLTPKTRAVIAVHLAGWPCDMDPILDLAEKHRLAVIEDCAQCHGAQYKGRTVGSLGTMAAFSFCQDKIMTTGGEGGMLLTDDEALWKKAWAFKDHGKNFDKVYRKEHPPGFRWLHDTFGTNWRLTEMQAAIGRVQLRKLSQWVALRRRNARILQDRFARIPALRLTVPPEEVFHSYYKHYVFVRPERLKPDWNRDRILNAILATGTACFTGSCSEIYREEAFAHVDLRPESPLSVAAELGATSLMFLVHPTLTERDMVATAEAVERVMAEATC